MSVKVNKGGREKQRVPTGTELCATHNAKIMLRNDEIKKKYLLSKLSSL